MNDLQQHVLAALKPRVIYRAVDAAAEARVSTGQACYALSRLVRGGVIEVLRNKGERRRYYMTKQATLFSDVVP